MTSTKERQPNELNQSWEIIMSPKMLRFKHINTKKEYYCFKNNGVFYFGLINIDIDLLMILVEFSKTYSFTNIIFESKEKQKEFINNDKIILDESYIYNISMEYLNQILKEEDYPFYILYTLKKKKYE